MNSVSAKAFLSHVFDPRIADTIERIQQICKALDVETYCVDSSATDAPSDEAKNRISKSDFLIAICTKKNRLEGADKYLTSTTVREEIAFAKALHKRVLCFIEKDVVADGFAGSMFTYSHLDDAEHLTPADLNNIISGVHKTKLAAITRREDVLYATGVNNFFVRDLRMDLSLKETNKGLIWQYVIEREYEFESEHDHPLTHSAFCLENLTGKSKPPVFQLEFERNGKATHPDLTTTSSAGCVEVKSHFEPPLKKGDRLFVRERYRSPFLAPIHNEQGVKDVVRIGKKRFNAYDGVAVVTRIQRLRLVFTFPRNYEPKDLQPVVATFSNYLDHANVAEVERLLEERCFKVETFDNSYRAELEVERPLYQYFYGVAWNPPKPETLSCKIAEEEDHWD